MVGRPGSVIDTDAIAARGLINKKWIDRLPNRSLPYVSTIVFLVRKGNPKGIKDWSDLTKPGTDVITANPVVSGGARWNLVAAYGQAIKSGGPAPLGLVIDEGGCRNDIRRRIGVHGHRAFLAPIGLRDGKLVGWNGRLHST